MLVVVLFNALKFGVVSTESGVELIHVSEKYQALDIVIKMNEDARASCARNFDANVARI